MESWILLLLVQSATGIGGGVIEIDRYPSLAACKDATVRAEMKAPGGDWIKIGGNQWACVPGRPIAGDEKGSSRRRRR
jgi:hypothetical protein